MNREIHGNEVVRQGGHSLEGAAGAVVLLHGRGASADDILTLSDAFDLPELAWLAPQAAGHTWYPYSFLSPIERNEPWLSSALATAGKTVDRAIAAGIPQSRIVIAGFSQGACLAAEFVARRAGRFGGLIAFTGGLIGPPETEFGYDGRLEGTPAYLGSGDPDPHVPWERVAKTASVLELMGAKMTARRFPGMPHTVSREELAEARQLLMPLVTSALRS